MVWVRSGVLLLHTMLATTALAVESNGDEEPQNAISKRPADEEPGTASPTDGRGAVEEVIVEGERIRTTLEESSHSITVFDAKALKRRAERTLSELLERVPNVSVDPFCAATIVRGIPQYGINSGGFASANPTSTGFMDGFFTPTAQPIWDAQQVEVLRGSENFLGGGGFGGMIAVTSIRA